jgi:hypothetical protein
MKKPAVRLALFIASIFIFSSCEKIVGEGPIVTETRITENFTGVSLEMAAAVSVTIGPVYRVEVSAQRNILNILQTHVINGVLHIDRKDLVRLKTHDRIQVNITMPSANYFRVSGSGDIQVSGDLVTANLELKMSGSGSILVNKAVVTDRIDADISGSGNISIMNGSAIRHDLQISGSGKIDLSGLSAENATARTSGSGDMKLNVSKKLDATISGSGTVYYRGQPAIHSRISGSGTLINM